MKSNEEVLASTYSAFNRRDVERVLEMLHPEVDWPNGMEGGRVQGRAGVREYWQRQWSIIDPRVDPIGFQQDNDGRLRRYIKWSGT